MAANAVCERLRSRAAIRHHDSLRSQPSIAISSAATQRLTSAEYAADYNEIKIMGVFSGSQLSNAEAR